MTTVCVCVCVLIYSLLEKCGKSPSQALPSKELIEKEGWLASCRTIPVCPIMLDLALTPKSSKQHFRAGIVREHAYVATVIEDKSEPLNCPFKVCVGSEVQCTRTHK